MIKMYLGGSFMSLFQILATINDLCSDALIKAVVGTVKNVLDIISIAVPIVLIILCTIDMFKAFTNGDEKERSKAWKGAIKRLVFAVIVFIVPWLVKVGFSLMGRLVDVGNDPDVKGFSTFLACWNYANPVGNNDDNKDEADLVCCKVGQGTYKEVNSCSTTIVDSSFCD